MNRSRGTTLLEVLTAIAAAVLLIALVLPAVGQSRRSSRLMQNSAQIKGIHQSMVMYSQGNRDWYPGLNSKGELIDGSTEYRFQIMLEGDYFMGEYITSPAELLVAWEDGPVTRDHYSYAMLRIADAEKDRHRREEWKDTANSQAVVLSDRNTSFGGVYRSVWTDSFDPGEGTDWRGSVGWNDNHVSQETTCLMENTQYGEAPMLENDHLFETGNVRDPAGLLAEANGAMMTFSEGEVIMPARTTAPMAAPGKHEPTFAVMVIFALFIGAGFGVAVTILVQYRRRPAAEVAAA